MEVESDSEIVGSGSGMADAPASAHENGGPGRQPQAPAWKGQLAKSGQPLCELCCEDWPAVAAEGVRGGCPHPCIVVCCCMVGELVCLQAACCLMRGGACCRMLSVCFHLILLLQFCGCAGPLLATAQVRRSLLSPGMPSWQTIPADVSSTFSCCCSGAAP